MNLSLTISQIAPFLSDIGFHVDSFCNKQHGLVTVCGSKLSSVCTSVDLITGNTKPTCLHVSDVNIGVSESC